MGKTFLQGDFRDLNKRGLKEDTCRKFGYKVGRDSNGNPVQIAPYFKDGNLVAQKVRTPDKDFYAIGSLTQDLLFGQHLWNASSGKKIIITEGEIDAMSVSQVQGNKWPVVSLPCGAKSAKKAIASNIEYLEQFEEVILMFDMDDDGKKAVEESAPLFSVGKCKVASLPRKDANEMLQAGEEKELINAIWTAKPYRPDGLVSVGDLMEKLTKAVEWGLPWLFDELTKLTYGRRFGEIYGFGAGTGIGKTDFLTQQIAFDIQNLGLSVGVIFLEQQPEETVKRIAGKIAGKRFHVPDAGWTLDELMGTAKGLDGKLTMYDSFGETDWNVVKAKIRYMTVGLGIKVFYLDHLTAMADTADEKGSIEQIMKEMAGIANELKIIIHFVSHLSTPDGKPHEEGGHVAIKHFKGSRAIGFWSYFMFGLERNQQDPDPIIRSTTTFRVLKDRYTGQATGSLLYFGYEPTEGKLFVTEKPKPTGFKDETETEIEEF